jgi:lysophospholipase L1-like esterase
MNHEQTAKNKTILYCSLGLNFILLMSLLLLGSQWDVNKIIKQKIARAIAKEEKQERPQPRRRSYDTGYYQMKTNMFAGLPNSQEEIVFLGDSLTDQGEWAELFQKSNIVNRGISGDTSDGVLNRLDEIVASKPQKIFLMIGVNDLWNARKTIPEIINNYQKLLTFIKQKSPSTQVFVQSLLPINNKSFQIAINNRDLVAVNQEIRKIAAKLSYNYLDLYESFLDDTAQLDIKYTMDGVHLNAQGYLHWKTIIEPYINR